VIARLGLIATLALFLGLLGACGEQAVQDDTPSGAYRSFFDELAKGNTQDALEKLAPEGALGSTFKGGSYYMLAREFDAQMERHGNVEEIIIDREDNYSDEEVMVEGRIVFRDGTEMPRGIRFTRENGRWVGHI